MPTSPPIKLSKYLSTKTLVGTVATSSAEEVIINYISAADILEIYTSCKLRYDHYKSHELTFQFNYKTNELNGIKFHFFAEYLNRSFLRKYDNISIDKQELLKLLLVKIRVLSLPTDFQQAEKYLNRALNQLDKDIHLRIVHPKTIKPSEKINYSNRCNADDYKLILVK